jgi:D-sedoheptulose 7-phosphate isomerase
VIPTDAHGGKPDFVERAESRIAQQTVSTLNTVIANALQQHVDVAQRLRAGYVDRIAEIASALAGAIRQGGTIYWCGNGGSAADSQHLAAELVGRYQRDRVPLASVALTTDSSALTAIANDFGYSEVFKRQVDGLVRRGDALVGISTSGNSENILLAIRAARSRGAVTIGLLGRDGGRLASECDHSLVVPCEETPRIQEMHITIGHILCDLIERETALREPL